MYREIYENKQFRDIEKGHLNIPHESPSMDVEPTNEIPNQNLIGDYYCDSESESESVKTINYLEDMSVQNDLNSRALRETKRYRKFTFIKFLIKLSLIYLLTQIQNLIIGNKRKITKTYH